MKNLRTIILVAMLASLSLVTQVKASAIDANKVTNPVNPNIYHVGDTIHYVMTVTNPQTNVRINFLTNIHDHEPNGATIYFVNPGVDPPIVQMPGDSNVFFLDYVVSQADVAFTPAVPPIPPIFPGIPAHMAVIDQFHSSGVDSVADLVNIEVARNSTIITPCIDVNKTVEPTVAIAGDEVTYTITICNCGDANLTLTDVNDDVLGPLMAYVPADGLVLNGGVYNAQGQLQAGECTTFQVPYTIQQGDPDPLCNEVCATGVDQLDGPAGTVQDCDPACVDLLEPNIMVEKTCDEFSKVGDQITYEVTITNNGQTSLQILSVDDSVADANQSCVGDILPPQGTCSFSYIYTVLQGDPDPLINTVDVNALVVGTIRTVSDSTVCETDLVDPNFIVTKECLTEPVTGAEAQFRITITNTGDVNLIIRTNEPELPGPNNLPKGGTIVLDVNRVVLPGATEVSNTVDANATLPPEFGLPNVINRSASASCSVPGAEGCTPGFWKNSPACWCDAYEPSDLLSSVFTIPCGATYGTGTACLGNQTLMQALAFPGGSTIKAKAQILLRAAVSALLNSCNNNVDYALSTDAIIAAVNDALASKNATTILSLATLLDGYNNAGCPISAANAKNPCSRN